MPRSLSRPPPPPMPPPPPSYGCMVGPGPIEDIKRRDDLVYIRHYELPESEFERFHRCVNSTAPLTIEHVMHREWYDVYFRTSQFTDVRKYTFTSYNTTFTKTVRVSFSSGEGLEILIIFAYIAACVCLCGACCLLARRHRKVTPSI